MAGQIYERGKDVYQVRIFLGMDANGKQIFHRKTIHGKKKDAQKYLTAKMRERDLGVFIEPAAQTLDAYLDKWLETAAKPRLRERTWEDYREYLKRYVRPGLGHRKLSDIKPMDVQNLYGEMLGRGLSARTVRYCHAILSSALKQSVKWQMLLTNPCAAVDLPRQQRQEMQALTPEEAGKFLAAAQSDKWSVIFELAITTGLRPEEYLGLQWQDLDFATGHLIVRRALVWKRKGGGWSLQEPKTSNSRRTIPLPASVVLSLRAHKRKQAEERLKAGPDYQNDDFIFAGELGNPLLMSNFFRRHFQPVLERSGITKKIRLYDLRHTCATLLLSAGENPKVVSERLGHASIVLTLDVYSHVLPSMQQAATDKLENMLFSKTGTL